MLHTEESPWGVQPNVHQKTYIRLDYQDIHKMLKYSSTQEVLCPVWLSLIVNEVLRTHSDKIKNRLKNLSSLRYILQTSKRKWYKLERRDKTVTPGSKHIVHKNPGFKSLTLPITMLKQCHKYLSSPSPFLLSSQLHCLYLN